MHFRNNELYHIYNRGNNRQPIFFKPANYEYFLDKVKKFIVPYCDILSYSLMPNHFHFLVASDLRTITSRLVGNQERNVMSEGIRNLLQTYTKGINKENSRVGSLFQQNTKAKLLEGNQHPLICFHYIHQNPLRAKLVKKMEDWQYSSFKDYCSWKSTAFCNIDRAESILGITRETFYNDSYKTISDSEIVRLI